MKHFTARNIMGVSIGVAVAGVLWLAVLYAGQALALVVALAFGLVIGLVIGVGITDSQADRKLAGVYRDLDLALEKVSALEATNAELRGKVAEHKRAARIAMETAANNLDRAVAAEAHLPGGAQ